MPRSISCDALATLPSITLIDVRKDRAKVADPTTIRGACSRRPFAAETWWPEFAGRQVVVFCVHGHEVSQAVCGFLDDVGIEARYLEGGMAAWREAGLPTMALEDAS